jgi:HEAT repeat protein
MNNLLKGLLPLGLIIIALPSEGAGRLPTRQLQDQDSEQTTELSAARDLSNRNPLIRQQAAETLARLAIPEQKTITEGYRLQEKNSRVRLALDWALYRMGKDEALFNIVKDLDSERQAQSISYLSQLESPEPLYKFIDRGRPSTQEGLFEVFARIGDSETLNIVNRFVDADIPRVAKAAKLAQEQITLRLSYQPAERGSRPRRTGTGESEQTP